MKRQYASPSQHDPALWRRLGVPLFGVAMMCGLVSVVIQSARQDTAAATGGITTRPSVLAIAPTPQSTPIRARPTLVAPALPAVPIVVAASPDSATAQSWNLTKRAGTITGFTDHVSAAAGDTLRVYVSTPAVSFDVEVYRLGWYNDGQDVAQQVDAVRGLPGRAQRVPAAQPGSGLISAEDWVSNGTIQVAAWPTGLYLLKLIAADGDQSYIPLVVRDDLRHHDFLLEHASTTEQAYNGWGGKSLYTFNSTGQQTDGGNVAAVKVSFDRPFDQDGSGGLILAWDLNFVRYLEANHFDVGYVSDLDVHENPGFADKASVVLQSGHNEYWSKEMRDNLESVPERGKGLGLFTGDTGAWAIRFEDSTLGKDRVQVAYKSDADPIEAVDPAHATTHWRDAPLDRATHQFFGVGSGAGVRQSGDWVVEGADRAPDLFAGTGLKNGDVVQNLVGYEYDGLWTEGSAQDLPANLTVLGRALVAPVNMPSSLVDFQVTQALNPDAQLPLGRLVTALQTLEENPNWALQVHLAAPGHTAQLVYTPGNSATPAHFRAGTNDSVYFSLPDEFYSPGWRSLDRDILADYRSILGEPASDLRIDYVTLEGTVSTGPLSLTTPEETTVLSASESADAAGQGWRVSHGQGQVTIQPESPGGEEILQMRATLPSGHRPDEADTVVIRAPGRGMIVAVGSIQWSWALDSYAGTLPHVDSKNHKTDVDPRLQVFTSNVLRALLAGSASS